MEKCEELVHLLSPFFDGLRQIETQLKCPDCDGLLQEPKLLPCDHVFCRNCLPTADKKQPQCPKCGRKFRPKDVRSFFFMEDMIRIFKEMDGAIADIFKQIMPDKSPIFDGNETVGISPDFKEKSHESVTSRSCKKDDAIKEGVSGCKDPSAGTVESAEGSSEEKNPVGSGKGSKRRNLGKDCINSEPKRQEIKSVHGPVNLCDGKCSFCHSSNATEISGPIVCYLNGTPVNPEEAIQERVIYVHHNCRDWGPNLRYLGDNIMNLEEEIKRGEQLVCSKCGVNGAVLGCSYGPCSGSYHLTCALEIDCHWNSENFKMLCPTHAFNIPKLDEFILVVLHISFTQISFSYFAPIYRNFWPFIVLLKYLGLVGETSSVSFALIELPSN